MSTLRWVKVSCLSLDIRYPTGHIRYLADIRTEPSYLQPYHYHACWCQLYGDWKFPALLKPRYPVSGRTYILYSVDIRTEPSYLEPNHNAMVVDVNCSMCPAMLKPRYPVSGRTYIRYRADIRTEPSYLEPYHYHACWCQLYGDSKCPALLNIH